MFCLKYVDKFSIMYEVRLGKNPYLPHNNILIYLTIYDRNSSTLIARKVVPNRQSTYNYMREKSIYA